MPPPSFSCVRLCNGNARRATVVSERAHFPRWRRHVTARRAAACLPACTTLAPASALHRPAAPRRNPSAQHVVGAASTPKPAQRGNWVRWRCCDSCVRSCACCCCRCCCLRLCFNGHCNSQAGWPAKVKPNRTRHMDWPLLHLQRQLSLSLSLSLNEPPLTSFNSPRYVFDPSCESLFVCCGGEKPEPELGGPAVCADASRWLLLDVAQWWALNTPTTAAGAQSTSEHLTPPSRPTLASSLSRQSS